MSRPSGESRVPTPLRITQVEVNGVALAMIQGLNAKLERAIEERDTLIDAQRAQLAELRGMLERALARAP